MSPEVTAAIIAAGVGILTLIGTLATQYVGRRATSRDTQQALEEQRKQLDRGLAEQRTRTLNERFATSAEQLGSDKPAVRLAGVYAMAGLADDWVENRQTCVDVLCAYLRMPYEPDPGEDATEPQRLTFQANREVRHTVIRVITAHLQDGATASWQGLNFDFTSVVFDGGDFTGARFSGGKVRFHRATFSSGTVFLRVEFSGGTVDFRYARFSGGTVDFTSAGFSGSEVSFFGAEFSGGTVGFTSAWFSGGTVNFGSATFSGSTVSSRGANFSGSEVQFHFAEFSGGALDLAGARFRSGRVDFGSAKFCGSTIDFDDAHFSGGTVDFLFADLSGGALDFSRARFTGGTVDFSRARFTGSTVDFRDAQFSGGAADFSDADDWSFPPTFPWTNNPPSSVKLFSKKQDPS